MAGRSTNPLQQMGTTASQMSTGGSYGAAGRARGIMASPAVRLPLMGPAGQNSQLDPTASSAMPLNNPQVSLIRCYSILYVVFCSTHLLILSLICRLVEGLPVAAPIIFPCHPILLLHHGLR